MHRQFVNRVFQKLLYSLSFWYFIPKISYKNGAESHRLLSVGFCASRCFRSPSGLPHQLRALQMCRAGLQFVQCADIPVLPPKSCLYFRRQGLKILIGRQVLVQQVRQAEIILKGLSHRFLTSAASLSAVPSAHVRKSVYFREFCRRACLLFLTVRKSGSMKKKPISGLLFHVYKGENRLPVDKSTCVLIHTSFIHLFS